MITSISLLSSQNYPTSKQKTCLGFVGIVVVALFKATAFGRKHHFNYFNNVFELFQPYLSEDFKIKVVALSN